MRLVESFSIENPNSKLRLASIANDKAEKVTYSRPIKGLFKLERVDKNLKVTSLSFKSQNEKDTDSLFSKAKENNLNIEYGPEIHSEEGLETNVSINCINTISKKGKEKQMRNRMTNGMALPHDIPTQHRSLRYTRKIPIEPPVIEAIEAKEKELNEKTCIHLVNESDFGNMDLNDVPKQILSCTRRSINSKFISLYTEWMINENGQTPKNSYQPLSYFQRKYPGMLIEFLVNEAFK